ncbi:MAG: hypothetical protein AB7O50_16170 [Pseudolabrys sp.]
MDTAIPPPDRRYELFVIAGGKRFYFRNDDCGVTLDGDGIAWTRNGEEARAPLNTIREVRLQSGGDWRNAVNSCQIIFAGGHTLAVTDAGAHGAVDHARTPAYRAFVGDLHGRLEIAKLSASIAFIAGYTQGRYMVVLVCAILLGLMGVAAPLVLLFIVRDIKVLGLLVAGSFLCWPLARMVMANAPRSYNPSYPPIELLE